MKLIQEYLEKDQYYKNIYGKKTILLYQVGIFFEIYGMMNHESYENVKNVSDSYGLLIGTKENKDGDTFKMVGFRDFDLDKFIEKMHPYGYTIVVYIQEKENDKIYRKKYGIFSPGTTFLEESHILSNHMSCIWIQKSKMIHKDQYVFGLSNINVMNGKSNLCEYYELYYHNPTTYDCIETFLNIYNPIEIIFIHNLDKDLIQEILQYLPIGNTKHHIIDIHNKEHSLSIQASRCESQIYQNEVILSFFPQMNVDIFKTAIEDKPIALQSFCFLLNFIHQQNVNLTEKILEPKVQNIQDSLLCANHSLKQLNIINEDGNYNKNTKYTSIIGLLNHCKTKIGKRHMNELLLNPINNKNILNKFYDITEHLLKRNFCFEDDLNKIPDIEKLYTKLKLRKMTPCDIHDIYISHQYIENIIKQIKKKKDKCIYEEFLIDQVLRQTNDFKQYITKVFQLDTCKEINQIYFDRFENINHKLFHQNVNKKLDHLIQTKLEDKDKLYSILEKIESLFVKKEKNPINYIKIHQTNNNNNNNSEISLHLTKRRSITLEKKILELKQKNNHHLDVEFISSYDGETRKIKIKLDEVSFKQTTKKDTCIFSLPILDEIIHNMYNCNIDFNDELTNTYQKTMKYIYDEFSQHFIALIESVKQMDIYDTRTRLTKNLNLCKPQIEDYNCSFIEAKKMRHILIEYLETKETYVPNDVALGKEDSQKGILLYGTNSVGKTSLIKSIGICIIMAQSGFYVPCESFIYCPYDYLFTRIIGNDNIFKGLSTFGVEMSELRVIIQNCNNRSLILGDELCSGTEIDSALSIFISSLEIMTEKQSSFIFATHFHELQQMKEMKQISSIQNKHLKVQFDYETQQIYYDRHIHDGPGESMYGLEVCKSLKMPQVFIDRCFEIRNSYIHNKNNVLTMKISKYNKEKLKYKCEYCNENLATEIHHLKYQKDANNNQYIENSFHKNHNGNLASICETCHLHIHALGLKYERRKTMDGNYELILKKN